MWYFSNVALNESSCLSNFTHLPSSGIFFLLVIYSLFLLCSFCFHIFSEPFFFHSLVFLYFCNLDWPSGRSLFVILECSVYIAWICPGIFCMPTVLLRLSFDSFISVFWLQLPVLVIFFFVLFLFRCLPLRFTVLCTLFFRSFFICLLA